MNAEDQKEFLDALEDRVYVVVITMHGSSELKVVTDKLIWSELTNKLKTNLKKMDSVSGWQSLYVAHYKYLETPVPSPDVF